MPRQRLIRRGNGMGTVVAGEAIKERTVGTVEPLIQLRGLEKAYDQGGSKFFVLRRINLDILAGEFVTIMEPAGAGKSTLLSIIGMLDGAWNGEYHFPDHPA